MIVNYKTVKGYQQERPSEVDVESSTSTVYLRKNIERKTEKDEKGEEISFWQYDEAQLSVEDFATYCSVKGLLNDSTSEENSVALMDAMTALSEQVDSLTKLINSSSTNTSAS